ncbi:uncharacterized protein LOC135338023 [Halichondria panicea]|uniref:uncharacterized protein LOC135338023 n=1 Tax=Halichondria panicea TaxID=6063 RepID=UPI00312BAEFF
MGMALESVLEEVRILLADKVVVGCSIQSDLEVLGMLIPSDRVRDIQRVYTQKRCLMPDLRGRGLPDHKGGPYSLKDLSKAVLGLSIQEGPHSTLHDALATMAVWLYYELPCNREYVPSLQYLPESWSPEDLGDLEDLVLDDQTTLSPITQSPPTTLPPTAPSPATLPPTAPSPATLPPTAPSPTTLPPTAQSPTTLPPTAPSPATLPPTDPSPATLPPIAPGRGRGRGRLRPLLVVGRTSLPPRGRGRGRAPRPSTAPGRERGKVSDM